MGNIDAHGGMAAALQTGLEGLVVLSTAGERICGKYFGRKLDDEAQEAREKEIVKKVKANPGGRAEAEVVVLDALTVVYRFIGPSLIVCALGTEEENPLIMCEVVDCLNDALHDLIKGELSSNRLLSNLAVVLLAIDETVDGGVVFETSAASVVDRVKLKGAVPEARSSYKELTLKTAVSKAQELMASQFAKNT